MDKVPNDILMEKLVKHGLDEVTVKWIYCLFVCLFVTRFVAGRLTHSQTRTTYFPSLTILIFGYITIYMQYTFLDPKMPWLIGNMSLWVPEKAICGRL